ncbi:hypothetical protein [Streptomyces canus]|uniref:hypothetical protein n=1 Tax=Streptomyces canus TaxID=58343 RepID=UPI002E2BAD7F|nr:hypothetical protein [Streptomyces canus]
MNSVPRHLHSEDRQEYERILDEALRSAPHRPELAGVGQRLNPEQLRTMALNATALITAAAATEYQHYVQVREEQRVPSAPESGTPEPTVSAMGLADAIGAATVAEPAPTTIALSRIILAVRGSGPRGSRRVHLTRQQQRRMPFGRRLLAAVLGVRVRPDVPQVARADAVQELAVKLSRSSSTVIVLAGFFGVFATLVCLLVGYVLKEYGAAASTAQALVTTGWVFSATIAGAILIGIVTLLRTAARNGAARKEVSNEASQEVAWARDAWREALLERGILPFLREALADPGTAAALPRTPPSAPAGRIPNLGYDRPGFSNPDDDASRGSRPSFSSPDYAGPDFGGPEHRSE